MTFFFSINQISRYSYSVKVGLQRVSSDEFVTLKFPKGKHFVLMHLDFFCLLSLAFVFELGFS